MKTNNPKDSKCIACQCPFSQQLIHTCDMYRVTTSNSTQSSHFPGCHKVHIECANKLINEAKRLITTAKEIYESGWDETEQDEIKWLKSLGEK